jgi:uncharacterized protein (TIGR02266 family)
MMKDGRRDKRMPIGLKIRFKSATISDFIEQYSRDISKGGIFIRMKNPMPVGTLIKFDFRLQDEKSLIQGVGRVVWRREEDAGEDAPAGMGIKFIKLDDSSRSNLGTILDGQPAGQGPAAEEPTVEQVDAETDTSPPEPIAPVRPVAVPRSAKRTMIGFGGGPQPSVPPAESPTEAAAEEPPAEPEETVDAAAPTEAALPAAEAPDEAPAPEEAEEAEPSPEEEEIAAEPAKSETELLADISSAIDKALSSPEAAAAEGAEIEEQVTVDEEEAPAADEEKAAEEEAAAPAAAAEEQAPTKEEAPTPAEEQAEEEEPAEKKEKAPAAAAPVAAKKDEEKKGVPGIVWFLLIAAIGVSIWYFGFYRQSAEPAEDEQPPDKVGDVKPEEAKPEEAKPEEAKPEEQPEPVAEQAPTAAAVSVKTRPEGAQILVDGKPASGISPLEISDLEAGKEVEVQAKLFGFVSASQKVVPGEEPLEVELKLARAKLQLELVSEPPGAQVTVDGKWIGKTPRTVVRKGLGPSFEFTMTKKGFEDYTGTISAGDWTEQEGVYSTTLNAALTPVEKNVAPPKVDKPKADKPKADKPKADKPKADKPKADKPKADKPKADKPKADKPKADKPKADKPKADKPKEDKPKADKPKADDKPKEDKPKPKPAIDDDPYG